MDRLDHIFALQKAFNDELRERRVLIGISAEQWIQKETLAMLGELAELLEEVNYKYWKNAKSVDFRNIKEELVDILHFFVSMCLDAGMAPEELYRFYLAKNQENFDRQHGKSAKPGYAPPEPEPEKQEAAPQSPIREDFDPLI